MMMTRKLSFVRLFGILAFTSVLLQQVNADDEEHHTLRGGLSSSSSESTASDEFRVLKSRKHLTTSLEDEDYLLEDEMENIFPPGWVASDLAEIHLGDLEPLITPENDGDGVPKPETSSSYYGSSGGSSAGYDYNDDDDEEGFNNKQTCGIFRNFFDVEQCPKSLSFCPYLGWEDDIMQYYRQRTRRQDQLNYNSYHFTGYYDQDDDEGTQVECLSKKSFTYWCDQFECNKSVLGVGGTEQCVDLVKRCCPGWCDSDLTLKERCDAFDIVAESSDDSSGSTGSSSSYYYYKMKEEESDCDVYENVICPSDNLRSYICGSEENWRDYCNTYSSDDKYMGNDKTNVTQQTFMSCMTKEVISCCCGAPPPTSTPSSEPSMIPSPNSMLSSFPSSIPSSMPSSMQSSMPSFGPTFSVENESQPPSQSPSSSTKPSISQNPSSIPSMKPSSIPSLVPSSSPSLSPSTSFNPTPSSLIVATNTFPPTTTWAPTITWAPTTTWSPTITWSPTASA